MLPPVVVSPLSEVGRVPAGAFSLGVELGFSVVAALKRALEIVTKFASSLSRSELLVSLLNLVEKVPGVR